MLSHLTLQLPSCLLPAAESVANCPFKKAASTQPGDVLFYFVFFLLLPQNAAVIRVQVSSVLHHPFLDCVAIESDFVVKLLI